MALTNQEAQTLIELPKKFVQNGQSQDEYIIRLNDTPKNRFSLQSEDGNQIFLLNIEQSPKRHLKITLHFQENATFTGLFRIDYYGEHQNPEKANDQVPGFLRTYRGQYINCSHVHIYVEGYKPLAWAIPIEKYDFSIKDIIDFSSFEDAISVFCQRMNVISKYSVEGRLFL